MDGKIRKLNFIPFEKLDIYIATSFILIGILSTIYLSNENIQLVPATITLIIFSVLYLVSKKFELNDLLNFKFSRKEILLLFIIIMILIDLSFISFIIRPELYSRPLIYFILLAIASGFLAFTILWLPSKKKYEYLTLVMILIIGLSLRLTPHLLFPSLVGGDPWVHMELTNKIISTGHLVEGYAYSRLPTMQLLIGLTKILTATSYKWSSIISVSFSQLISLIVIYLIGKYIFNSKVGLIAALILCISANYISLGYWIHPTTYALIAATFLLYFLLKEGNYDSAVNSSIKILFGFIIVTAHMQVALAILMFLISFWIGKKIFLKVEENKFQLAYSKKIKYTFIFLFAVIMFSWWIYVTNSFELPISLINRAIVHDPSKIKAVTATVTKIPFHQYLMNIMPYLFFYGFSIIGFLFAFTKKSNSNYFGIVMGAIVLLLTPFLLLESNLSGYLAERWIYASQIFGSLSAVVGIIIILKLSKRKISIQNLFFIFLISAFVFVNLINPSANIDNSQLAKDSVIRYAFTSSELQSTVTINKISDNMIYTDYINTLPFHINQTKSIEKELMDKKYSKLLGIVVIRSELLYSPLPNLELNYNPIKELSMNVNFDRIFDSGSEVAFLNKLS